MEKKGTKLSSLQCVKGKYHYRGKLFRLNQNVNEEEAGQ